MPSEEIVPAPGVLLIAPPMMQDPNFRRTVVLLCEHTEEGSFGLVLNRSLSLQPSAVLEGMEQYDGLISLGGPVQPDTLHVLHRHGDHVGDAVEVADCVFWGGNIEAIQHLVEGQHAAPNNLRFFLGYAGWSPGQLEHEISLGGWILARSDSALVFTELPERLWRDALRRMGGAYALLANFPDDPRMN